MQKEARFQAGWKTQEQERERLARVQSAKLASLTGSRLILHKLAAENKIDLVRDTLRRSPEAISFVDHEQRTPVHVASFCGHHDVLALFLYSCREPNAAPVGAVSVAGRTALHEAALNNHVRCIELLLAKQDKQDINMVDVKGRTPLLLASMVGSVDAVRLLMEKECQLGVRDSTGRTEIDYLRENPAHSSLVLELTQLANRQAAKDAGQKELAAWLRMRNPPVEWEKTFSIAPASAQAADRVRKAWLGDEFDTINDTFFEGEPAPPHANLFKALAFGSTVEQGATTVEDMRYYLELYDKELCPKSLLILLAHARLCKLESTSVSTKWAGLLQAFAQRGGTEALRWLTTEESDWVTKGGLVTLTGASPDSVRSMSAKSSPILKEEWESLATEMKLSAQQRKPFDALLELVGLEEVKRIALRLFSETLADTRLKASNQASAIGPRTLNFVFAGNPGTGKTTVHFFMSFLVSSVADLGAGGGTVCGAAGTIGCSCWP
jgi:hypothetical protein